MASIVHPSKGQRMAKLEAGTEAPSFSLPDQDGTPVSLDDFKG